MRTRTIWFAAIAATLVGCAAAKPRTYGAYADLSPKVAPKEGERTPQHLSVELAKPANVAVFLVVPGGVTRLLFPGDSTQSGRIEAGTHVVETAFARNALSDTSRLLRRPGDPQPPAGTRPTGRGAGGFDATGRLGAMRGYLLVYASQDSLPYSLLATRVHGISVPVEDSDALNTVTKLVREVTRTTGTWAAYASEYP